MIHFDVSGHSVVITCSDCPGVWFAFAFTRLEGYDAGARHLINTHDIEPSRANRPGELYKMRHAQPN